MLHLRVACYRRSQRRVPLRWVRGCPFGSISSLDVRCTAHFNEKGAESTLGTAARWVLTALIVMVLERRVEPTAAMGVAVKEVAGLWPHGSHGPMAPMAPWAHGSHGPITCGPISCGHLPDCLLVRVRVHKHMRANAQALAHARSHARIQVCMRACTRAHMA